MVDLGFRVDEGLKILSYRKCSKYHLGLLGSVMIHVLVWRADRRC